MSKRGRVSTAAIEKAAQKRAKRKMRPADAPNLAEEIHAFDFLICSVNRKSVASV